MSRTKVSSVLAISLVFGTLASLTGPSASGSEPSGSRRAATAAPGRPIPNLTGFYEILHDPVGNRVWVSGGHQSIGVDVFTEAGAFVDTYPVPGASGLLRVGNEILVASPTDGDIYVFDAVATPSLQRTIHLGGYAPTDLASVGGRLWFTSDVDVHSVAFDGLGIQDEIASIGAFLRITGDPSDEDRLVVTRDIDDVTIFVYDTSVDPPSLQSSVAGASRGDVALTPGGGDLVAPAGDVYRAWSLPGLTAGQSYTASGGYLNAVDTSPAAGGYLLGGSGSQTADLHAYHLGEGAAFWKLDLGGEHGVQPHGIAIDDTGTRAFVVSADYVEFRLNVVNPLQVRTRITLRGPREIDAGKRARLKARLTGAGPEAVVRITATPAGRHPRVLVRGAVGANGILSTTWEADVNTEFTATFIGDIDRRGSSASKETKVRAVVDLRLYGYSGSSGAYKLFPASGVANALATVSPRKPGGRIHWTVEALIGGRWKRTGAATFRLSRRSSSDVYVPNLDRGRRYRIRAVFLKDSRNASGHSDWMLFKAV